MPIGSKLSDTTTYLNVLDYGPPGTGKTTGALTLANLEPGKRVLLIDAEGGAKAPALRRQGINIDQVDIWPDSPSELTYDGIEEIQMDLRSSDEYIGVVIDSMTELNRRLLEDIVGAALARAERLGKNRDRFQINLEDYGVVSTQLRTILRRFHSLPMHLVITALERRDVDAEDASVTYGPALGPSVANDTMGLVDIVCYHMVELVGDKEQPFFTGLTSPARRRKAKDRFGVLPTKLIDPTTERMIRYVEGTLVKSKDPRQEAARRAARGTDEAPTKTRKPEALAEVDPEAALEGAAE